MNECPMYWVDYLELMHSMLESLDQVIPVVIDSYAALLLDHYSISTKAIQYLRLKSAQCIQAPMLVLMLVHVIEADRIRLLIEPQSMLQYYRSNRIVNLYQLIRQGFHWMMLIGLMMEHLAGQYNYVVPGDDVADDEIPDAVALIAEIPRIILNSMV